VLNPQEAGERNCIDQESGRILLHGMIGSIEPCKDLLTFLPHGGS